MDTIRYATKQKDYLFRKKAGKEGGLIGLLATCEKGLGTMAKTICFRIQTIIMYSKGQIV